MGLATESHYVYYRRVTNTQITGPDVIDGSGTYTFIPDVTPSSCTWSVEPAAMFQHISDSGSIADLSYVDNLTYLAPKATLTFTFGYSCDNHYTVSKEIDLLIPTTTISGTVISDGFVIDTSATVTITGLVSTNPGAQTIVPIGTKLVLDGGRMTGNNGSMWPGIQVWGDRNTHQHTIDGVCGQGSLELRNGAVIENAISAVELWRPDYWNSTGGIIYADSAIFRNNARAVRALFYTNHNPVTNAEMNYNGTFRNCTFTIDADYPGTVLFNNHIDLCGVNGVSFKGCSFSVLPGVNGVNPWCQGIYADEAGFTVTAYSPQDNGNQLVFPCPYNNMVRSSFSGFHKGIYSFTEGETTCSITVSDAVFTGNDIGISILNTSFATILKNSFSIGKGADCSYGIVAKGVTGLCVEENEFVPNTTTGDSYGIRVFNCPGTNDIYLNSFSDLTCGNIAVGRNFTPAQMQGHGTATTGLTYSCNRNEGNTYDFSVQKDNGVGGIQSQQGAPSMPAGNTFDGSLYHFYNDGDYLIDYYHYANDPDQIPGSSYLYRVNSISTTTENSCRTHYGLVVKSADEKLELENDYLSAHNAYSNLARLYESHIDGGSTPAEVADVQTASPSDQWRLRAQLLGHSPYLSEEVLTTVADRDDVFSDPVLFEIFAANPDELRKDTLIAYLEGKSNPLPTYMTDMLRQMASGTTARTALMAQMSRCAHERNLAAGDMVRSNLNEAVANPGELRVWLGNMDDIASDRVIVASYVQEGDFERALALAGMLPELYHLSGDDLEDHSGYMRLLNLYKTLGESGRTKMQMTDDERGMVENLAAYGKGVSRSLAEALIESIDHRYAEGCNCPDLPLGGRSFSGAASTAENSRLEISVTVTPNPTNSQINVEYRLSNGTTKAALSLRNALGVEVMAVSLEKQLDVVQLDMSSLAQGVYYIHITDNSGRTYTDKVVKQ